MHKVNSMFAQRTNRLNKQTKKYHETAEKYIDDFHCDSVVKAYYALYRNGVTFFLTNQLQYNTKNHCYNLCY